MKYLGCQKIRDLFGVDGGCCPSCHDDAEAGYTFLLEYEGPGWQASVCCDVVNDIGDQWDDDKITEAIKGKEG